MRLIRLLILVIVLCLTGCSASSHSQPHATLGPISVEVSARANTLIVPEDPTFRQLLNTPDAVDNSNAPPPKMWHRIDLPQGDSVLLRVKNCPHLDLLDLIAYDSLDSRGRPVEYHDISICEPHSSKECSSSQMLSSDIQQKLISSGTQNFALSGICITRDGSDNVSFIAFMKQKHTSSSN